MSDRSTAAERPSAGRVIVAGGTGLIGRHLCPALREAGYEVVVLTRGQSRRRRDGIELAHWAPAAPGPWAQSLEGARAVINLCGEPIAGPRWTEARKRRLLASRVMPSQTLVRAMAACDTPPEVLVQASGVGYTGPGEAPVDESAPPGDDFLAHLAQAWEAPLADAPGRWAALRFGVVLARDGGALPQMLLPFRLFAGGPIAGGQQWLPWVHVADAVRAIRFALDHPVRGAVHVTAPEPVRNAEFARIAGRTLGRPACVPVPRLLMQALLGEQATLVCDGQQAVPARLAEQGFHWRFRDLESALRDLLGR
jgi:uncharacterized protein (TIGR01777 family)